MYVLLRKLRSVNSKSYKVNAYQSYSAVSTIKETGVSRSLEEMIAFISQSIMGSHVIGIG